MANESTAAVLRGVQTIFRAGSSGSLTDGQLLDRYRSSDPDAAEAAFAALVERHAGMVYAVCRAVLGNPHDADDALQGTFLILARQARSIHTPGSVAGWLARVARRVAIRAKERSAVRRAREREAAEREERRAMSGPPEAYAELYDEIDRLPAKFRGPVVLCDLEGLTYEQAANQLLVPVGTVRSRLARARQRLGARLRRRGLTPAIVGLAMGLGPRPSLATPPVATTEAILRAAMDLAGGHPVAGAISAEAARLALSYLRSRLMVRIGMIAMTLASVGLIALGAGMRATPRNPAPAIAEEPAPVAAEAPAIVEEPAPADKMIFARVVDAQGRPIAGQVVHVVDREDEPRTATADLEGMVQVPDGGFGRRRRLFLIAKPDEKTIGWTGLGHPDEDLATGTADDPLPLTLQPRDSSITGTLVDRAGKPVRGVVLRVEQMHNETNGWLSVHGVTFPGWPIVAVTDDQGRYTIPVPRGTRCGMRVRHRRYTGPWINADAGQEPVGSTVLDRAGGIVGVVTNAAGRPVAGLSVGAQLLEHRSRVLGGAWGDATTDDRGRFEIQGLEAGVYNLLMGRSGSHLTAAAVEGIRVKAGEDTKADLTAIGGRKLRGSVVDPDTKAPLARVMVGYYGAARPRSGAACISTFTDATGRFELTVPPGPSYVYIMDGARIGNTSALDVVVPEDHDPEPVQLPGRAQEAAEQPAAKAKAGEVRAFAGRAFVRQTPIEEPLGPVTRMTGRVVDPAGRPIPGVALSHSEGSRFLQAVTDRDGDYVFEGLPEGALTIHLRKDGYPSSIEHVGADVRTGVFILHPRKADRTPAPDPPESE